MSEVIEFAIPEKIVPVLSTNARCIVLIGGRGSAKSESVARILLMKAESEGADVLCGREYQNSIDDSVHKLLKGLANRLYEEGTFRITDTKIDCSTGGGFRFKGFARNSDAVKSAQDFKYSWIEEAQSLSQQSIDDLLPTIRSSGSQLFFTANPQASTDPFSKRFIVPYLPHLLRHGYYEDRMHLIIMVNYRDNPWFPMELELQRQWDLEHLSRAKYDHIWNGAFNDTVDDAIILAEWFDAAVDAHKKLGFEPRGKKVLSHDCSDTGGDEKAVAIRHGVVFLDVLERPFGDVNDGCDWSLDIAVQEQVDGYTWDGDGMGVSLRRQVQESLRGKKIDWRMFKGSEGPSRPTEVYQGDGTKIDQDKDKTNRQVFKNKRAQYYWNLRDRFFKTYLAVEKGKYIDPDELISISSGIENLGKLRSEICRIPRKPNGAGMIQIMTKDEMKRLHNIESPNMADAVMMNLLEFEEDDDTDFEITFKGW